MKKFLLVVVLIITTVILSGCYDGLVSDEEYSNLIAGIVATKDNGESVSYNLDLLKDETHFNNEIESAKYCKLEILHEQECKVKSICFFVRSSQDSTFTFSIFSNDKMLDSFTKECKSFESEEIDFFLTESITLNSNNNLYILIEEQTEDSTPKTNFVFDTFVIFFEEV